MLSVAALVLSLSSAANLPPRQTIGEAVVGLWQPAATAQTMQSTVTVSTSFFAPGTLAGASFVLGADGKLSVETGAYLLASAKVASFFKHDVSIIVPIGFAAPLPDGSTPWQARPVIGFGGALSFVPDDLSFDTAFAVAGIAPTNGRSFGVLAGFLITAKW